MSAEKDKQDAAKILAQIEFDYPLCLCESAFCPCWQAVASDAIAAAIATAREEGAEAAWAKAIRLVAVLQPQGTMNFRRGHEEGIREALRTLEAASKEKK